MSSLPAIDIFGEDSAHERFVVPVIERLAREAGKRVTIQRRWARGGHGRALEELGRYGELVKTGVLPLPDIVVVSIDANCKTYTRMRTLIQDTLTASIADITVIACPDPHVERWLLADPESFAAVVGRRPHLGKKKCARGYYKDILARTVKDAVGVSTLGGLEWASDLVEAMDFYRAGKVESSLGDFLEQARTRIKAL